MGVALAAMLVLAGCGGQPAAERTGGGQASGQVLTFVGDDQLRFSRAPERAPAGRHTIRLVVDGSVNHNVAFDEIDDGAPVVEARGDATATGSVVLAAGTYTYFCSVPGHRAAGMEGTLIVD